MITNYTKYKTIINNDFKFDFWFFKNLLIFTKQFYDNHYLWLLIILYKSKSFFCSYYINNEFILNWESVEITKDINCFI